MIHNSLSMILVFVILCDIQGKNQHIRNQWSVSCKG